MIIDAHIHATYWSKKMFLGRGVGFNEIEQCLDECGIDGAVLTTTDLRRNQEVLDYISNCGRRYWFFPWTNPLDNGDIRFLEDNIGSVHGIKIHPSCDRVRISDTRVRPILDLANAYGLPVMVHCGRWEEISSYRYALEVAALYPEVDFILSHMGGDLPELEFGTIEEIETSGISNVYLGIEGVREYWAVQNAVDRLGAERIIFGSDFPLGHPKMYLGLVDALKVDDDQRQKILAGNILRILREET